jgi:hypothetical protein
MGAPMNGWVSFVVCAGRYLVKTDDLTERQGGL